MAAAPQGIHPASLVPLPTPQSTRVLHLHPGISTAPISGSLSVVDLAGTLRLPYDAISYTWGPEPTPAFPALPIMINGQEVFVRQNLHQCLLRLRLQDTPRRLWNDFLCIDQERLDEKARQVTMIGKVFREADTVRVWVGEHEGGSEMLFRGWPRAEETDNGIASGLVKKLDRVVLRRSKLSRAESKTRADVWMRFFNRRYWQRTWIVQEVHQARQLVVHCGADEMGWKQLIADRFEGDNFFDAISLRAILNVPESAQLGYNVIEKIRELDVNRRGASERAVVENFYDKNVLFFTQRFRHSWATIPHDKVWAFLSMEGSKYQDHPITVDYELPLPDLLVMIYRSRLVMCDEALSLARWRRLLPEAHMVVESLRLNQIQRVQLLRAVADQAAHTTDEIHRQRWQRILTELEFAVEKLWQRDRKINGYNDASFNRDWNFNNPSWSPMPTPKKAESSKLKDEVPIPTGPSARTRLARLRFNGDRYYATISLPFGRKGTNE